MLPPLRKFMLGLVVMSSAMAGGCEERRIDESQLYKGMDRSTIIAQFGTPDKRRIHDTAERLTYLDGDKFQYLLLLVDDQLQGWQRDRVYRTGKYFKGKYAPDKSASSRAR